MSSLTGLSFLSMEEKHTIRYLLRHRSVLTDKTGERKGVISGLLLKHDTQLFGMTKLNSGKMTTSKVLFLHDHHPTKTHTEHESENNCSVLGHRDPVSLSL